MSEAGEGRVAGAADDAATVKGDGAVPEAQLPPEEVATAPPPTEDIVAAPPPTAEEVVAAPPSISAADDAAERALLEPEATETVPEALPVPPIATATGAPTELPNEEPVEELEELTVEQPSAVTEVTAEAGEGGGTAAGATAVETPVGGTELEELILPSSVQTLAPLPDGTAVDPDGRLRIERQLDGRGRVNRYRASWRDDAGELVPVELREGPADHPELQREAEVLAEVRYAMLPSLLATFERDGRRYLAVEWHEGETLEGALASGLTIEGAVSIVLQLTQVLRRLHRSGWALLGLHPANVVLGRPLRLTHLGTAVRIGRELEHALQIAGYTAPEVAHRSVVTGKEDVYTLGALLYRVLAGTPVPEQGPELAALASTVPVPGAPQLLGSALAPVEERVDLEALYQHLLAFKRRSAQVSLTLQIVGGTTIGLNRTRLANEDACVYTTWLLAHDERIVQRAVLCVVDGMGGMAAGEVASRAAVEAVLDGVSTGSTGPAGGGQSLEERPVTLVKAAARSVYAAAQGRAVGATITCVIVDDGALSLAHVGDTRAYLLREGVLTQLTHDHSLVAAMVASGVLTKEEARGHPDSNKVLRSLGGQQELTDEYIDTLAATGAAPLLHLREGDQLLLCSDGVWGVLTDDLLREIMLGATGCPAAVQTIIQRVLEGGAPDNATLIVARCGRMPSN